MRSTSSSDVSEEEEEGFFISPELLNKIFNLEDRYEIYQSLTSSSGDKTWRNPSILIREMGGVQGIMTLLKASAFFGIEEGSVADRRELFGENVLEFSKKSRREPTSQLVRIWELFGDVEGLIMVLLFFSSLTGLVLEVVLVDKGDGEEGWISAFTLFLSTLLIVVRVGLSLRVTSDGFWKDLIFSPTQQQYHSNNEDEFTQTQNLHPAPIQSFYQNGGESANGYPVEWGSKIPVLRGDNVEDVEMDTITDTSSFFYRDHLKFVKPTELVVGDVVVVSEMQEGTYLPADLLVVFGSCSAKEAMMTGESELVKKRPPLEDQSSFNRRCSLQEDSVLISGSAVLEQSHHHDGCLAMVVKVGKKSSIAAIQEFIGSTPPQTNEEEISQCLTEGLSSSIVEFIELGGKPLAVVGFFGYCLTAALQYGLTHSHSFQDRLPEDLSILLFSANSTLQNGKSVIDDKYLNDSTTMSNWWKIVSITLILWLLLLEGSSCFNLMRTVVQRYVLLFRRMRRKAEEEEDREGRVLSKNSNALLGLAACDSLILPLQLFSLKKAAREAEITAAAELLSSSLLAENKTNSRTARAVPLKSICLTLDTYHVGPLLAKLTGGQEHTDDEEEEDQAEERLETLTPGRENKTAAEDEIDGSGTKSSSRIVAVSGNELKTLSHLVPLSSSYSATVSSNLFTWSTVTEEDLLEDGSENGLRAAIESDIQLLLQGKDDGVVTFISILGRQMALFDNFPPPLLSEPHRHDGSPPLGMDRLHFLFQLIASKIRIVFHCSGHHRFLLVKLKQSVWVNERVAMCGYTAADPPAVNAATLGIHVVGESIELIQGCTGCSIVTTNTPTLSSEGNPASPPPSSTLITQALFPAMIVSRLLLWSLNCLIPNRLITVYLLLSVSIVSTALGSSGGSNLSGGILMPSHLLWIAFLSEFIPYLVLQVQSSMGFTGEAAGVLQGDYQSPPPEPILAGSLIDSALGGETEVEAPDRGRLMTKPQGGGHRFLSKSTAIPFLAVEITASVLMILLIPYFLSTVDPSFSATADGEDCNLTALENLLVLDNDLLSGRELCGIIHECLVDGGRLELAGSISPVSIDSSSSSISSSSRITADEEGVLMLRNGADEFQCFGGRVHSSTVFMFLSLMTVIRPLTLTMVDFQSGTTTSGRLLQKLRNTVRFYLPFTLLFSVVTMIVVPELLGDLLSFPTSFGSRTKQFFISHWLVMFAFAVVTEAIAAFARMLTR